MILRGPLAMSRLPVYENGFQAQTFLVLVRFRGKRPSPSSRFVARADGPTLADHVRWLPQNIFEHMKFKSQSAPTVPPTPAVKPASVIVVPPTSVSPVPTALDAPAAATGKRKPEGRPTAESLNSASAANTSTQNGQSLPTRSVSSTNPHNLLARLSITSPTTPPPPGPFDGQPLADKSISDRPLKRQKTTDQTGHSLLARIGSSSELGTSKLEPAKAMPARQIKVQSSLTTSGIPTATLPVKPQAVANVGPSGTSQNNPAVDTKITLGSGKAIATPLPPPSTMSIKGAAAKVSPPRSEQSAPFSQTQGMLAIAGAANLAATAKRPGASQTHGAVSFQRALASINQPPSSLDSLRTVSQQPKEVVRPEPRLPPKPTMQKVAPPLPATTSLLQRFTNGEQPKTRNTAAAARGSLTLSERLQAAPGDMEVDEPNPGGSNQGQRKRRGRK